MNKEIMYFQLGVIAGRVDAIEESLKEIHSAITDMTGELAGNKTGDSVEEFDMNKLYLMSEALREHFKVLKLDEKDE